MESTREPSFKPILMGMPMTTTPPTPIRIVRPFGIRLIPQKPPAPSVRRRVKSGRRAT
jgi:hypothetical protein